MVSTDDLIAATAISIGVGQMMFRLNTVNLEKIDTTTYPMLYSGIIASILWFLYQYRKGANYSAVYSILGLILQLYILFELTSRDRNKEKTSSNI